MRPRSWKFWQQPLTRRERRFLRVGLAVLALILLYIYLQQPLWGRVTEARTQRDLQQAQLDVARNGERSLPAVQARLESLRREVEEAQASLPAGKEEPQFLRSLARVATAQGVQFRYLTMEAPAQVGPLVSYPFRLTLAGPAEASRRFLQGLEEMDRLVQVKSFHFDSVDKGELTLEAVFYSDPAAETAGAAGGATP